MTITANELKFLRKLVRDMLGPVQPPRPGHLAWACARETATVTQRRADNGTR